MSGQEVVMCSGACGKYWPLDDIDECPWELLTIKKAVRCWECGRALAAVGQAGAGVEAVYKELEPTDRGALKKMPERAALREAPGRSSGNLEWEDAP
jgi:hypothetical protein